jgi:hypothetical protein
MKKNDIKGKRFSFLPTRKKEMQKANPQLAHCLLPTHKPTLRKSQRAKFYLHHLNELNR